jgi:hypothetical protein
VRALWWMARRNRFVPASVPAVVGEAEEGQLRHTEPQMKTFCAVPLGRNLEVRARELTRRYLAKCVRWHLHFVDDNTTPEG